MNKVALITGAGRRFGYELAESLLNEGYTVFAHYNSSKQGVEKLEKSGAIGLQADFSDNQQIDQMVDAVLAQANHLDLLVNNASCFFNNDTVDQNDNALNAVYQVHAVAPYKLITGLSSLLAKANDGLVINITDIYSDRPSTDYIAYCGAKAALANMTQAFAKSLAPEVRVNAIQPGPILFLPEHDSAHKQQILEQTPLTVEGGLQPMIDTVRFLRDNTFLTGESIKVDGGRALKI
ncbi:SDR family NAD(P)-dependent oxidoreductase [Idiomarina seosinensis]|uniref:Short-chain dehydrogenase n=1 Tax=Idiomarina seosinensis TaxID=281739 RepID=A0A432ZIP4_9GAMM|nr:SDR family NAD(P)-dependent oxidoreductase [Idiomarina seosinensis]RUO77818.1 short-chain dehydrogenase [Idiomarina seosinensis]